MASIFENCKALNFSGYMLPTRKDHYGVDLHPYSVSTGRAVWNCAVLAVYAGTILFAGWHGNSYGNLVILEYNGKRFYHAHLASVAVRTGQTVKQGDKLGIIGTTGNSTGVHLHFEKRKSPYRWPTDCENPCADLPIQNVNGYTQTDAEYTQTYLESGAVTGEAVQYADFDTVALKVGYMSEGDEKTILETVSNLASLFTYSLCISDGVYRFGMLSRGDAATVAAKCDGLKIPYEFDNGTFDIKICDMSVGDYQTLFAQAKSLKLKTKTATKNNLKTLTCTVSNGDRKQLEKTAYDLGLKVGVC